jgi:hypothetical protein
MIGSKKITALLLIMLCFTATSFGQEEKTVLSAPDSWLKEIIPFPLSFAPSIPYVGFEDLRFAPDWSDSTNQNFWTYMFVWYVDKSAPVNKESLSKYFNAYYDGLMQIEDQNKDTFKDKPLQKTYSAFIKMANCYTGEMRVYDNFFTKNYITLNIRVKETFCEKMNKQIIRCDLSAQPFTHEVWDQFDLVAVKGKCK